MCNHYRTHPDAILTWREYIGEEFFGLLPEIDLWPKRKALVVRNWEGRKTLDTMGWGVPLTIPGKRPGSTVKKYVTNVRNLGSPFWRPTLSKADQRCLVPFSSFAEPKIGAGRDEHWFTVNDAPLSAFAGLWKHSEAGDVFAFLTCDPNSLIAPLHPKAMPVILDPNDFDRWLDGDNAEAFAQPFPSQLMALC